MIKNPEDCVTMGDVRAGVDEVDELLVGLLARRFGYMAAAARIKTDKAQVRDEKRKAQVIGNAKRHARAAGVPVPAALWELLVERSISYEAQMFDSREDVSA